MPRWPLSIASQPRSTTTKRSTLLANAMNLSLSIEQQLLRDSARRWAADHYDGASRARRTAAGTAIDRALWSEMADLGWLATSLCEADGGLGGDPADFGVVAESLGEVLGLEPFVACGVVG